MFDKNVGVINIFYCVIKITLIDLVLYTVKKIKSRRIILLLIPLIYTFYIKKKIKLEKNKHHSVYAYYLCMHEGTQI